MLQQLVGGGLDKGQSATVGNLACEVLVGHR